MIKLNYTLTVYFNTGFNGIDIPANASVLETANKKTYTDTYYLREDIDAPQIIVNDNYHNLSNVDYVKLVASGVKPNNQPTTFYYFASPKPYAGGTTCLTLDLDALLTCGGASELNYTSGWQERGHIAKSEDTLFGNLAPEAWSPKQCLVSSGYEELNPITGDILDREVIISNIDIASLGARDDEIKVIEGKIPDTTDPTQLGETVMYLPRINPCDDATEFVIQPNGVVQSRGLKIPNTLAFDADNTKVKKGLAYLLSCGQLQLQNSYTIPKEYVLGANYKNNDPTTGVFSSIQGIGEDIIASNFPFEYTENGYAPKNKKCYSTFREFTLVNLASSATISKQPQETAYNGGTTPTIRIWADMCSTGKPFARFMSDASPNMNIIDCIQGSQWVNHQILLTGASGSIWNNINSAFAQQNIDRQMSSVKANQQIADIQYQNSLTGIRAGKIQSMFGLAGNLANMTQGAESTEAGYYASKMGASDLASGQGTMAGIGIGAAQAGANLAFSMSNAKLAQNILEVNKAHQDFSNQQELDALRQARNENYVGLLRANAVVAPTTIFTPEPNLAMYGFNKFVIYETRKSHADLLSEDMYYQRYGYNGLHRPLTKACFNCRDYYVYVQAFDINIKTATSIGMRIKAKAIEQLNNGVRVWKVLPDAQYYETN